MQHRPLHLPNASWRNEAPQTRRLTEAVLMVAEGTTRFWAAPFFDSLPARERVMGALLKRWLQIYLKLFVNICHSIM